MTGKAPILSLFLLAMFTFAACDKQKGKKSTDTFDKQGMLSNIGENIIAVSYAQMLKETDSLELCQIAFAKSPTLSGLLELQKQFLKSYEEFQTVASYELGPADAELFRANLNTFPCDTTQIRSKIANGDFSISSAADIDAKGFPAVDYLIFDVTQNNAFVLNRFTTDPNAANALKYLSTLVTEIALKTRTVNTGWTSAGGNYLSVFVNNTSSNVGSSIGMLVNQLCFDLEILKNASIGIPAGKKSLGVPFPEKTEAYYSRNSLILAKTHLKALEDLYLGSGVASGNGTGFDDYLTHIGAMYNTSSLNEIIIGKFKTADEKLDAIPETLAESISSDPAAVDAAYNELQQLVVLLKVDMTSALGIQITYQDNDGD